MIPIRVPATLAPHIARDDCRIGPGHPLHGHPCPVCDEPLGADDQPIALVGVGIAPDDRKPTGWTSGAAVAVHTACATPTAPPKPPVPTPTGPWTLIPVDQTEGGPFDQILSLGQIAADLWTVGPEGPYHRSQAIAVTTRSQLREALLHLLELGLIDIDAERLQAAGSFPARRGDRG